MDAHPHERGGRWSDWRFVVGWSCPQDALPAFTAADFRRLPLAPSAVFVQPPDGWTLVGTPAIVHTDPAAQTLTTTLLGYPVSCRRARRAGPGTSGTSSAPLVTSSPGRAYPHADLAHAYTAVGTRRITLDDHVDVDTSSAGASSWAPIRHRDHRHDQRTLDVLELRTHLVEGPCTGRATTAGCP